MDKILVLYNYINLINFSSSELSKISNNISCYLNYLKE